MDSRFTQKISEEIWHSTYKWETDKNWEDTCKRVAKDLAKVEKEEEKDLYEETYFHMLYNRLFVPGGRILSNSGTGLNGTTLINCFVQGFQGTSQDSIQSIYDELHRQANILKSEGGYGFCVDVLRPRGAYIKGIGIDSPGAVEFLNLWDTSSSVVTSGSGIKKKDNKGKNKIRKGAMMVTMSCNHPSIEEFITAKRTPGKLTKFNMSVLITDEFMDAVKNHYKWSLWFPDTTSEKYDLEWDGNFRKWVNNGYPIITYKTFEDANELYDLIMNSTYNHNEPGVLFIDTINNLNNLKYTEYISATNPCGEQPLPISGSCNLGSINLVNFIKEDNSDFDYDKAHKWIKHFVRFQDSINDVSLFPLDNQKIEAQNKRRVGIGYMGYGTSLYLMEKVYGSDEANEMTDKFIRFCVNEIYKSSALLAKEKGCFPVFNKDEYLKSNFIKQALDEDTINLIKEFGIRNSHLTMVAPTGNTSLMTNNVSGGIEPVVFPEYTRTMIVQDWPEVLPKPENIDWAGKKYDGEQCWEWINEGKDTLLRTSITNPHDFTKTVFKIDKSRGLVKEEEVYDYAVSLNPSKFEKDLTDKKEYIKHIYNLDLVAHLNVMRIFAKYTDAAISKTINLPKDYPYEDFKQVYMDTYDTRYIKGITTYREGTMASVVSVKSEEKDEKKFGKRPEKLKADIHRLTVSGEKWIVFIGLMNDKPFEVFAGKVELVDISAKIKEVFIVKKQSGVYQIEDDDETIIVKDINKVFSNDIHEGITRLLSILIQKDGLNDAIKQLNKSKGTISSYEKGIMRALKKYIKEETPDGTCPECGEQLIMIEGCIKCKNGCVSKCG